MATSCLSVVNPLDLTKESRQALIQHISILRSPSRVNCMPAPECLREFMGGRFGEILYIEEFHAGGRQGLFVTFVSRTSRDEFITFTKTLKDPKDPLFTLRGTERSVDAFSLLAWYKIPSSLEKILTGFGLLKFMPGLGVPSKSHRYGTHSAIPTAPKSLSTKNTSWRSDSVTGASSIPSSPSFPKLPSRPDTSASTLPMRTSSLETNAATEITRDKLWRPMSSTSSSLPMHTGHQTPPSNRDWGWTTRKTAFAEGFERDISSVYSGNRQKSVATAQDISPHRVAPQTSVATVSTPRPSNAFSPIQGALPPISTTVESSPAQLNVQNPKVKVEDFFPDTPQSQDTRKDAATDPSYLEVRKPLVALKTSQSELRVARKKLAEAEREFNEIRLQAAIDKTRLAEERYKRKEIEKKVKELQDEVEALSSCKKEEAKFSEVEVQTLSLTSPQESSQMDQKRPMDHASTQTEIEDPGVTTELEEIREGGVENKSELDQPKVAYAKGLEEKQGGMEMLGVRELERDSELKRHWLVHEQKLAESSAEIEWLRNRQKESEDALQQQRQDHAEQLAELRREMETRKIEALATQFPAASKLLISAYIRLESLGKRKREDDEI